MLEEIVGKIEDRIEFLQETEPTFLVDLTEEEKFIVDRPEYREARKLAIEKSLTYDQRFMKFMSGFPKGSWKLGFSGWDDGFLSGYKQKAPVRNGGVWHEECIGGNAEKNVQALTEISRRYYLSENKQLATDFAICNVFQGWAAGIRAGWCGTACLERDYCGIGSNYDLDRKTQYCKG